jgi:hypothetical protein
VNPITDNIDNAKDWITGAVADTADAQGWSQADRDVAFSDITDAYDGVTGLNAVRFYAQAIVGGASSEEAQVSAFYGTLTERAANWTAPASDKLYSMLANLTGQVDAQAERTISTPVDVIEAGAEVVTETASDVATIATSRTTWVVIGAALVGVLVLLGRRR